MSGYSGFYVRRCAGEDRLWTVGFDLPRPDGSDRWEPESDHDSEREARQRAWLLNGVEGRYAYFCTEPGLWTVGDLSRGFWDPVSDHGSKAEAASEVIERNA